MFSMEEIGRLCLNKYWADKKLVVWYWARAVA